MSPDLSHEGGIGPHPTGGWIKMHEGDVIAPRRMSLLKLGNATDIEKLVSIFLDQALGFYRRDTQKTHRKA
jgi:hypothetical protein